MSINIEPLKMFAAKLPLGHPLREALLLERDELPIDEFLIKVEVWLKLSSIPSQ
jgi:hypothetical protein